MADEIQKLFTERIKAAAEEVESETGIVAIIAITQAALESSWGQSGLTLEANNLFGMTAGKEWLDSGKPVATKLTKEYSDLSPENIKYWERPGDVVEKVQQPDGKTRLMVKRDFRKYKSWTDSMLDWAKKITTDPRYSKALEYARAGDVEWFGVSISEAGYATDPRYADKIAAVGKTVAEAMA